MDSVKSKAQDAAEFIKKNRYGICIVTGLIVIIVASQLFKRRAAIKRMSLNEDKCQAANAAENTIFVVLNGTDGETETLQEIFNKALCPGRIRVAAQNEKSIGAYDAKARRMKVMRGTRSYIENVRLTRSSTLFSKVRESYRGEKYVFTFTACPTMQLRDGWDEEGIRMHTDAPPKSVLSICPSGRDNVPGFPCADVHASSTALVISTAPCTDAPPRAIPALFFYSPCSVALGTSRAAVPSLTNAVSAAWEPAFLSAAFFCAGYNFVVPTSTLMLAAPPNSATISTHESMPFKRELFRPMPRQLSEFEENAGIVLEEGETTRCSARAVMGLSAHARPEEILVKFGSWAEYDRVLNSLTVGIK